MMMTQMSGASPSRGLTLAAGKYDDAKRKELAEDCKRDGYVVLKAHFNTNTLRKWSDDFAPMLERTINEETEKNRVAGEKKVVGNRGPGRFYVTLPFNNTFCDATIYEDPDVLAIVLHLVGSDPVMCQLATDTPILGSEYQEIHRDTPPLFSELAHETPAFQLAVNFPLCDVTSENGPVEIAKATHMYTKEHGIQQIASNSVNLEPIIMQLGDVMIRDVRGLHRGTPNRTNTPRPMVVIGYSRKWLFRPEVSIEVPKTVIPQLSENARWLLRFNPIVDQLDTMKGEKYQSFLF